MPLETSSKAAESFVKQKIAEETGLMTCTRCGRQDTLVEADTGLCLVCVGKELESA